MRKGHRVDATKHESRTDRTAKDERDYVANLRREEPIKTEIISKLRAENKSLWQSQKLLLEALIDAQDRLRVYRAKGLEGTKRYAERGQSDILDAYRWNNANGWYRVEEE